MKTPLNFYAALCCVAAVTSFTVPAIDAVESSARPAEPEFATVERQFRELPPEARRLTGPLFWLHGEDTKDRLEMYVGKVAEGGNGSFTTESRPHNDWLGPTWWRDLGICLDEARKQNLQMWIFDEKWWPSQAVGGKVPARYAAKRLEGSRVDVEGPRTFEAEGYDGERYIAAVAGRVTPDGKVDGDTLLDLKPSIQQGKLRWQVPDGKWRVMKFTHQPAPGLVQQNRTQLSVDGASKDCVDWYLQTVYQAHFNHFGADFGKTIRGFFYDEPETPGDWGTELNRVLAEWNVDWKKAYAAYKFGLSGEQQVAARYQYLDAFAEAWGRTMYGGLAEWCHRHGVQSIGHFMEHGNLYQSPEFCAGDMMRLQGHGDMGGIDAVFDQFVMGKRVTRDAPCWQTPKLGSSISHAYGKRDDLAMVEIFGARGQDLTYPEMKWWADHMQVSGVNFLIPHSFNPRAPHDTDCPPYFYNGGFEARWPLYRVFADYTSRLSVMLTGGRHVCPVALLFLGQSAQCGKHILPEQISESLQDALYDCDWLPFDVFEKDMALDGKALKLRTESYRVLVVPPAEVIPFATLAKAKQFFDAGGVVIGYGFLPTKSATVGRSSSEITQLREAIWGTPTPGLAVCKTNPAGGRSYVLPAQPTPEQLQQVLAGDAGIHPTLEVLEGKTDHWVHVLHRVKDGRDIFFVVNQNHEGNPRTFRIRLTAKGVPECWDAMRGEVRSLPFSRSGEQVELSLTMEPNESALLVFQPQRRPLPSRSAPGAGKASKTITVSRDPTPAQIDPASRLTNAGLVLDGCSWVWYPEGNPTQNAPAGTRYFRKALNLPAGQKIKQATFFGTADNCLTLYINGRKAGQSDASPEGWRNPVKLDVTTLLQTGPNQLALEAANYDAPNRNPAGVIGRLTIEFESGSPLIVSLDKTWKVSREKPDRWTEAGCDDRGWAAAQEIAAYGSGPWGTLSGNLTLSGIKADPFFGHCEVSQADLANSRVYLELGALKPEIAARVTINGKDAGGFIGKPARLEITKHLHAGQNSLRIEPFAPEGASLAVFSELAGGGQPQ